MFARKPGKGITLEMYIRNTQVNKKKEINILKFPSIMQLNIQNICLIECSVYASADLKVNFKTILVLSLVEIFVNKLQRNCAVCFYCLRKTHGSQLFLVFMCKRLLSFIATRHITSGKHNLKHLQLHIF